MRAVIVDDEPLARQRLRDILEQLGDVECVGEAADGEAAIAEIDRLDPDIVFLDIQMPAATGLEVIGRLHRTPPIIFTTAHDEYAVRAFELQAVDYLLKPFGRQRVAQAIDRLRQRPGATPAGGEGQIERARQLLAGQRPDRILVRDRGRLIPISTRDITRLASEDDYTRVFTGGSSHLIYLPLGEFEQILDPARFVRVHRSHVVSLEHVRSIDPVDAGRLEVLMIDGTRLPVSRARSKELRERAF